MKAARAIKWLVDHNFMDEVVGFIIVIYDQVIKSSERQKFILKHPSIFTSADNAA